MEVGGTGWWLHGLAGARERVEQDGNENNDRNKRQPNALVEGANRKEEDRVDS